MLKRHGNADAYRVFLLFIPLKIYSVFKADKLQKILDSVPKLRYNCRCWNELLRRFRINE